MLSQLLDPIQKSTHKITFTSVHAIKLLARIETFIEVSGGATTSEASEHFHMAHSTVCAYLRELRGQGRIRRHKKTWEIGEDTDFLAADTSVPEARAIVSAWSLNHVRDPLVAALFGERGVRSAGVPSNQPRCVGCKSPEGSAHGPTCIYARFVQRQEEACPA